MRMKELNDTPLSGNYDFKHLCDIHKYIFQDLYEWAGTPRIIDILKHEEALKGDSVYYAKHGDIEKKAIAVIERMKSEPWEKLSLEQKAEKFSEHFADLWKVHPFRDGNTRAITHFCCQYADKNGIAIDSNLFADYSSYLRDCLVMANRGTLNPLRLMVFSAMQQGQKQKKQESLQLLKYVKKRDGR
jgi:cell filamentation protein